MIACPLVAVIWNGSVEELEKNDVSATVTNRNPTSNIGTKE